jgi:transposase
MEKHPAPDSSGYKPERRNKVHLKGILNRVAKYRSFVYERVEWGSPEKTTIEAKIVPRANSRPVCSGCNHRRPGYDTLEERRFEFVPLWGIAVFFLYVMRRVNCPECGVRVEVVPWATGKQTLTTPYMWFLALWARKLSWMEVARSFGTSWEKVYRSVEMAVEWGRAHMPLEGITAIGVDEVHWHRGQKYLTLVYQIDRGCKRLLWIGEDRKEATLESFFDWLGEARAGLLKFICSDMWKPYLKVIALRASAAIHILDRFHIMAHFSKRIDKVRAEESRKLKSQGLEPVLTHSRWCLLKRPENLTDKQDIKLADLLQYNLKTVRAYLLKEDFQSFWDYKSATWAGKFLDSWCTRTMRSKIGPMKEVARMLRSHRDLILNWFEAKGAVSTGAVEGLNNKVKVTTRKSYGFRTLKATKVALYHTLGKLPEPQATHRFC